MSGLSVATEQTCNAEGVESSVWAGTEDEIAELHDGPLSPYDGIVFPNYHYVQIEHIVARKKADESGLCDQTEATRKDFAAESPPDMACMPDRSPGSVQEGSETATETEMTADPRVDQTAAQDACKTTVESKDLRKNCTHIKKRCPNVDPIRRGEPLYGLLRDTDNDGVACESF